MLPPTTTPWLVCSSNKLNWYLPPYEEWLHDFCHSASSPPIRWNRFNNNKMFANFFLTGSIIYAEDGGVGWSVSQSVGRSRKLWWALANDSTNPLPTGVSWFNILKLSPSRSERRTAGAPFKEETRARVGVCQMVLPCYKYSPPARHSLWV